MWKTESEMKYIIEGSPVPLARARYGQRKVWDSQKELKLIAGINLKNQHGNNPLFIGPLHLTVFFFIEIPASRYRQRLSLKPHFYKPDLSNLLKFIEDIATGIIYHDDALIAHVTAYKLYDVKPRTEFTIEEMTNQIVKYEENPPT